MSYQIYLVQRVELTRLERFNVGLFAIDPFTRNFVSRFLSDDQWVERFGTEGDLRAVASFDNWKAWRNHFDRIDDLSGILSPNIPRVNSYVIVAGSERIYFGDSPLDERPPLDDYADAKFTELVL